ncbi:hypothetical protein [Chryseolinea sp. H1M3-3]|uniref:hypothetical protein n=1 Tax=Chryseolinea sp. H1M3-3 TaxID=3034144 RepID=UPI0023ED1B57|nr:hypothetical protein [Chryseolinea sp. H1M3-3]
MFIYRWFKKHVEVLWCKVLVWGDSNSGAREIQFNKYFIVLVLFVAACGHKELPALEQVDLAIWKEDKFACSGKRASMVDAMNSQADKLLALSQQEIVELLGKPDANELYKRNQKFFYYFLQPSKSCSDTVTTEPKKLVIRFNAMGLAKEIAVE